MPIPTPCVYPLHAVTGRTPKHTPPLRLRYDDGTPDATAVRTPSQPSSQPRLGSETPRASQRLKVTFADRAAPPTAESVIRNFPGANAGGVAHDANRMAMQMLSQHASPLYGGQYHLGDGGDDESDDDEVWRYHIDSYSC